jgi:5-methylcytosine-specific restriction protein B
MAHIREPQASAIYAAAAHWAGRALQGSGGVFTDRAVWTQRGLHELSERLAGEPPGRGERFEDVWHRRLDRASTDVLQLAAELLWVHLLFPSDVTGATKRRLVQRTTRRADPEIPVPAELDAVLDGGIAPTGIAYKARRHSQVRLLLLAARGLIELPGRDRKALLADPWALKAWLGELPPDGAQAQREALMHLLHPDWFEPIVSLTVKRQIVGAFRSEVPPGVVDLDQALLAIRRQLQPVHGEGFRFTDPKVVTTWKSD